MIKELNKITIKVLINEKGLLKGLVFLYQMQGRRPTTLKTAIRHTFSFIKIFMVFLTSFFILTETVYFFPFWIVTALCILS